SHVIYYWSRELYMIVLLTMVRISIEHGNVSASAKAYALYGALLSSALGDYAGADSFGRLALELCHRYPDKAAESRVKLVYAGASVAWRHSIFETVRIGEEAQQSALLAGDAITAMAAANITPFTLLVTGAPLDSVRQACASKIELARKLKHN